jgi:hypothetical protein
MSRIRPVWRRATTVTAAAVSALLISAGVASADNIVDDIVGGGSVSLTAGSPASGTASIWVVGPGGAGDGDVGCNWDTGESPLVLTVVTPSGVTASPSSLSFTECDQTHSQTVSFTASSTAVSGAATVTIQSRPAGGGTYNNNVSIPITVAPPPNSKPSVAVTGVSDGASYVIGSVPQAFCSVTDAEDGPSSFPASLSGSLSNGLGTQTATCDYTDDGGLAADQASATYTIVPPPNTKPAVAVTGVSDGASYEIGSVPAASCSVTDTEDGPSSFPATVSGSLSHGLGTQTATCDYTDNGGLAADQASATYSIVDTGDPTIGHTLSPSAPDGENGWYRHDVSVTFTCADPGGSGIQSCTGDTTLGEGEDQQVTGTATDWAGNTTTDTVTDIDVDKTAPAVQLVGGPQGSYYYGDAPADPTCDASDDLSGLASCVVTGGGTTVGSHSFVATATDLAGNTATATLNYSVLPWTTKGFYSPVDMGGVWNTVKGGSTVPLKFELFAGPTELTSTSAVASFKTQKVSCSTSAASEDAIELVTTGGTSLRYDSTGGQFVQNWKTPTGAGTCYSATMTSADGSSLVALFKIK